MKRLLVQNAHEGLLTITGPGHHHLVHVLRARNNDTLEVFNGEGLSFAATIVQVNADNADLQLGAPKPSAPMRKVSVIQGLPKGDKFELILQKCTELGASEFFPVSTERSLVKLANLSDNKVTRWQTIVDEAARQSGRSDVPHVHTPVSLTQCLQQLPEGTKVLVLDEEEKAQRLGQVLLTLDDSAPIALLIGPEGGLTRAEITSPRALSVSLGALILRTETAAFSALTIVRHLEGVLG